MIGFGSVVGEGKRDQEGLPEVLKEVLEGMRDGQGLGEDRDLKVGMKEKVDQDVGDAHSLEVVDLGLLRCC